MKNVNIPVTISESLTWGKLKKLLDDAPEISDDMIIDHIRLKGASNAVYLLVNEDNEIVMGD